MTTTLDVNTNPNGTEYWLTVNNKIVSYALIDICFTDFDHKNTGVFLEIIETRNDERNKGFATLLLDEIKKHQGVNEIFSQSWFTRDGLSFIAPKIKTQILEIMEDEPYLEPVPPTTFVENWDTKLAIYR